MANKRTFKWTVGSLLLAVLAAPLSCGAEGADESDFYFGDGDDTDASGSGGAGLIGGTGGNGEQENEATFRAPVVSGPYLWTANPLSDRVARIHAESLEVELYEAGHGPTFLSALPQGATEGGALVLNELSNDASIFLLNEEGEVVEQDRFAVQDGASAWAVGAAGKYAIAWSKFGDSSLVGIDGHQDLTLFDFTGDEIQTSMMAVGYRPSEVFINQAETFAYVVADPGISVISLNDHKVVREIFLPEGNLVGSRDIEFSPDGSLAMSRTQGSSELLLIDTKTTKTKALTLPGVITDLDMSEDGALAVAVVSAVETEPNENVGGGGGEGGALGAEPEPVVSAIAIMDPETVFEVPIFEQVPIDELVGSVVIAADGSQVVLYTNASASTHLTILDPETRVARVVDLKAPARAAFLAEDGSFAVALMSPPAGSTKSGAFALVPVAEALPPRIEGTENLPEYVSLSAEFQRALITTAAGADGQADAFFAQFPGLLVDHIALPSRPLATGLVPDVGQGFVAQEHAEGRVTFVDLDDGNEKTVTGFELTAKVVD